MQQQDTIGRLAPLRAPRVGFGILALAMAAAFVAGIAIAVVAIPVRPAIAPDTAVSVLAPAPAATRGTLNAQDFGSPPQVGTTGSGSVAVAGSAPYLAPVNVHDFGAPAPAGWHVRAGRAPLNVQDFGSPAQSRP